MVWEWEWFYLSGDRMALSTFFIAIYISVLLMTIFFIFHSFFLLTVDVFQDFFGSIIIQLFLSSFIACLHRFACCWLFLLFNLWETGMGCLTFWGGWEVFGLLFLWIGKVSFRLCLLFFIVNFTVFCYYVWTTIWIHYFYYTVWRKVLCCL